MSCIKKNNFGVLGPNIKSVYDGVHQNPMKGFNITHKNVCKQLIKAYLMLFANKLNLTSFTIKIRKKNKIYNNEYTKEYQISKKFDYILHGSCLIFSKEYMRIFPKGLNSNTYMYYEEHILAYQCYCNGIKMIYSPELEIEHYRNVSTNMLSNKNKKKERINFFYRQSINSLKVLKKLVKEGNNEIKET